MADEAKAKAYAAYSAGEFATAIKHFSEAIELSPTNHVLYSNRSAAHASLQQYSEAFSDAKKTVEIKPDWSKGYSRLGAAHLGLSQFDDAVSAYQKGLEIDPNNEALKCGLDDAQLSASRSRSSPLSRLSLSEMANGSEEQSIVLIDVPEPLAVQAPLVKSYNNRIRPLLDAVDKLRHLGITSEGIQLPTIVVVGDQSSGKSSVLESLAGINLPRGQGICTRVPLIMRLQNHPDSEPKIYLEFNSKTVPTDETNVADAINIATDEIAGDGKGISQTPLTLVVKKNGVPDLTLVDLPGITRVPVHGQPPNIYDQISATIMEHITAESSIILNVLSAHADFSTCESISMSQKVDKTGERTLAVVTKADKNPEGLLEKVTADDVNIGLGYVCVRNRIGDESYGEARAIEAELFESDPLLSKIDKSIVGIPVLAQRLVQIQAVSMAKCLPDIVRKIDDNLNEKVSELSRMPKNLSSVSEALTAFLQILGSAKESLRKILVRGEFDEYPNDTNMHCTARFVEMLNQYADELKKYEENDFLKKDFLMEEIGLLEEAKGITLPNFLPRTAFLAVLRRKVDGISTMPVDFVNKVWNYTETAVFSVLMKLSENYPQLQSSTRRAALNLFAKVKERSLERVKEIVENERLTDYTCDPEYLAKCKVLMNLQHQFMQDAFSGYYATINLEGFGVVKIEHLREYKHVTEQAFDLKMRMTAYWKIVLKRLVDNMALHLVSSVHNLVNKEVEIEIGVKLLTAGPEGTFNVEHMLQEAPSVAAKREKLNKSINKLKESKDVLGKILDRIALLGDHE